MRKGKTAVIVLLAVLILSGCKSKYQQVDVPEAPTLPEGTRVELTTAAIETEEETVEEPVEHIEMDGKIRGYSIGEMVDVARANRRSAAVMMSSDKEARPQYDISRAGVVYEVPAEGRINWFMAIIEDYDSLERIGSARSCRTCYAYFAGEFDAVYAHYGQSTFVKPYLSDVDNINGLDGIGTTTYYRSKDKKLPHNAYTSGSRLRVSIEKLGYRDNYTDSYRGHYLFVTGNEEIVRENSLEAYKVHPGYNMNQSYFSYGEKDRLYYRYQYGAAHSGDEEQIAVRNIILQHCPVGHYATTDYLDINAHADEYGYYIIDGRVIPISWKKDGEFGITHYYDTESNRIVLNKGKAWACIVPTSDFKKTEIYGRDNS